MQHKEFRDLVGMEVAQRGLEALKVRGGRLDEQQDFGGALYRSLPAIDGLDAGHEIDACGQMLLDEEMREALGLLARAGGGENDAEIGGGQNHTGHREQRAAFRV